MATIVDKQTIEVLMSACLDYRTVEYKDGDYEFTETIGCNCCGSKVEVTKTATVIRGKVARMNRIAS